MRASARAKNSLVIQAKIEYHDYGKTTSGRISTLPAVTHRVFVESVCVMMLRLCLSWSRGMTYKHLRILPQLEVSSLRVLPNARAHQPYLTGSLTFCWPRFGAGSHAAQELQQQTNRREMLLDGRLLASGRLLGSSCLLDQNLT